MRLTESIRTILARAAQVHWPKGGLDSHAIDTRKAVVYLRSESFGRAEGLWRSKDVYLLGKATTISGTIIV